MLNPKPGYRMACSTRGRGIEGKKPRHTRRSVGRSPPSPPSPSTQAPLLGSLTHLDRGDWRRKDRASFAQSQAAGGTYSSSTSGGSTCTKNAADKEQYATTSITPMSQLDSPFTMVKPTSMIVTTSTPVSKGWKLSESGTSRTHEASTRTGIQKRAICIDEPIAMPIASSILFFMAKMMAAACSAAFPTMGIMMVPRNRSGTPHPSAAPSRASTMYSERTAITTVMTASQSIAPGTPSTASSSSYSSSSDSVSSLNFDKPRSSSETSYKCA
mmetsp:Transcript_3549/g.10949  ORF Transcript_3549/g.10949 Transcript_3549/m.10949 type:complete len:271 (-) Transcript_3549:880-1692(-)